MKHSIIPMTCLILSPILILTIPVPVIESDVDYALDFAGGRVIGWHGLDKFENITYFTFFTFFKSGINPDCIDMVDESKTLMNNVQV